MPCNTCNHSKTSQIKPKPVNKSPATLITPNTTKIPTHVKIARSIKTPFSNMTVPEKNLVTAKVFGTIFTDMKNNPPAPGENTITDEARKDYRWTIVDIDPTATLGPVLLRWREKQDSATIKFILKDGITKKSTIPDLPVSNLQQYTSGQMLVDTVGVLCRNYITGMILAASSSTSIDGTTNADGVEYTLCVNKADYMRYVNRIQGRQFESLYYSSPQISTMFRS